MHFEWGSQWYVMVVIIFSNDSLNSLAHGIFELFFDWIQWLMVDVFIVKLPSEEYCWTLSAHGASHLKQRAYVNPDLCRHMASLGKWFVNFGRPVYFDYEWIHPAVKIYEKPIIAIKLWPKLFGQRYGCWRPNPIRRWDIHGYSREQVRRRYKRNLSSERYLMPQYSWRERLARSLFTNTPWHDTDVQSS